MRRNEKDRLQDMILFFAARCPSGKTKLAKLLWEADVEAFRRFGRSISGRESYVRLEHGPMPEGFERSLAGLRSAGMIVRELIEKGPYVEERHHLAENAAVDFSVFEPEEVDVLHTVIERLRHLSAKAASERTHDVYWQQTPMGRRMRIGAAAMKFGEVTEDVLAWAESMREEIVAEEQAVQQEVKAG